MKISSTQSKHFSKTMKKTPVRLESYIGYLPGAFRTVTASLALMLALGGAPSVRATSSPPDRMTYQGFLVDGSGNPLAPTTPVNYPVVFRIYDASDAGRLMWAEQQVVTVDKGNFSVVLGEGAVVNSEPRPGLSTIFAEGTASDRYLGITVNVSGNNLSLLPRLRLLPSPYAFLASQAVQLVNPSTGAPYLTTAAGNVNVTGTIVASGGLSGLTAAQIPNLDAAKIVSGSFPDSRIPTTITGNRFFTGSLGVGTTTVNHRLEVAGSDNVAAFSSSGGNAYLRVWDNTGFNNRVEFASRGNGRAAIWSGNDHLNVLRNGNVGIGTISPKQALHVNGDYYGKGHVWFHAYEGDGNNGTAYIQARDTSGTSSLDIQFRTQKSGGIVDTMRLTSDGRVGVGTVFPEAPLHVVGGVQSARGSYGYLAGNGSTGTAGNNSATVYSIIASARVAASEFNAYSDRRAKNVIGLSDGRRDLETLLKLRVSDYRMVDTVAEGDAVKKGFIAQEVEAVIPEAVSSRKGFVPDIYVLASSFEHDATTQQLTVALPKQHGAKEGDRFQIFADDARFELSVAKVLSPEKLVFANCEKKPAHVFVYGREVTDFKAVNYDRIFTTGISAIQELYQVVQSKEARIASLEEKAARVDSLESEVSTLKKQLAANDEARAKWEARFAALEKLVAAAGANPAPLDQDAPRLAGVDNR